MIKLKNILNEGEPKEKEKPAEKEAVKTLTSVDFINGQTRDKLYDLVKDINPETKKKVLSLNFDDFLKKFDNAMLKFSAGNKNEMGDVEKIGKQVQSISLTKYIIYNKFKLDSPVKDAALQYQKNAKEINSLLRTGIISDQKLTGVIRTLDKYFKSEDSRLQHSMTVYRGVSDLNVFKKLIQIGRWQELGFLSTSMNPLISQTFAEEGQVSQNLRTPVFKIQLKAGFPIIMVSCADDPMCTDTEVTLPRGCKFTVVKKNEEMNIYTLSVEL